MDKVINIIPQMEGVTTVLVAMLFVCLIFPALVKHTRQFYAVVGFVIGIVLLHALTVMVQSPGFAVFTGALTALLQAAAVLLIVMSVGGLSPRELASDIKGAYEVVRRGETEKEVIIPIGGQMPPRPSAAPVAPVARENREPEKVIKIDENGNDVIEEKPQA